MHLILDMDKTLIWGTSWGDPIEPRPFLQPFLRYCFQNFETVSIWTAATRDWFATANVSVFCPILTALNAERESEEPYSFFFVYTKKHTDFNQVKNLEKVWTNEEMPHTRENTLTIDDKQYSYEKNPDHVVLVDPWCGLEHEKEDDELVHLMDYLTLLQEKQSQGDDIFSMNKTDWKTKM
uniref:Ctd-like (NLI interacting factor-like) phosphatase n=1 Tax=Pithovirus LCPAC304 TaxID=2506594 RepID=A0A481Z7C3_9VIRU|nr:MAG: ctd-like (NLI interacting factor-like) phosphatase [Pithovirus LCPAC304]